MISIAMAVYNGELYLRKQLDSIINQSLLPDEIVITDDSSNDLSYKIINEYILKYKSIEWKYIKNNKQLGFCNNFIKAINNTTGDIIFLSDQDDIWDTSKIEKMVNSISTDNNIDVICCHYKLIDKNDSIISDRHNFSTSKYYNDNITASDKGNIKHFKIAFNEYIKLVAFPGACFAIKKNVIHELNKFVSSIENQKITYHDLLISYIAERNDRFYLYGEALNYYRIHDANSLGIGKKSTGPKEDRIAWLQNLINTQTLVLGYAEHDNLSNNIINNIEDVISFNKMRLYNLKNNSFISHLSTIIGKNQYISKNAYFGDLFYILNKIITEKN